MRIPGFIFILIGSAISYTSYRVGDKLIIFFYAGLLMAMYGLFKTIISYVLKERATNKYEKQILKQVKNPQVVHCSKCGTAVYSKANYCYNCGNKLK